MNPLMVMICQRRRKRELVGDSVLPLLGCQMAKVKVTLVQGGPLEVVANASGAHALRMRRKYTRVRPWSTRREQR